MKIASISKLLLESNTHNPKITKKVFIKKGDVLHLTNFTQAEFPPGEIAKSHSHSDLYEIFFVKKGRGIIKLNGQKHKINEGDCITVEPGDTHEVINSSSEKMVLIYFGIEI